ncbi:hypothetical protein [Oryzihumus sp.]
MNASLPPALRALVADLGALTRQQALLRLVVALAPVLFLAVAHAAGASWSGPVTICVVVLALASAAEPDSHVALVVLAVLGWFWAARVGDPTSWWALAAAWVVLVGHGAGALAATVPSSGQLPRVVVRQWATRAALVGLLTAGVWGLARAGTAMHPQGRATLTVLALLALAGVGLWWRGAPRRPSADPDR